MSLSLQPVLRAHSLTRSFAHSLIRSLAHAYSPSRDAFCGGLLFALSQGRELGDAVRVANAAGAAAVKSMGAVLDDDALRWFRRKVDLTA